MISNMRRRIAWTVVSLAALLHPLSGQESDRPRERIGQGGQSSERSAADVVTFEPNMFAADSGLVRVDVLYRIRFDFFVFTREVSREAQSYRARGEVLLELIDSTETSVSRSVQAVNIESPSNEISHLRRHYYQGAASFLVHPGRFTAVYRVEDGESKREFADRKVTLNVRPSEGNSVAKSTVLFVEPSETPSIQHQFTALNFNHGANFSRNTGLLIMLTTLESPPQVRYTLLEAPTSGKERVVVQRETTVTATLFRRSAPALGPSSADSIHYIFDKAATSSTVYFTLATAHLKQGRYVARFQILARDTPTVRQDFVIRWVDMPLSLFDLDFAVTAMKYITTEDEYDDLRSGSRANRIRKFEEFWAKRDPTPATAYNEVMTEYFRRVDYAFVNFRTLREENGVLTDRGRIYILDGKPSDIERVLRTDGPPREIWTYSTLKRQYIFEDPSRQGNYKLIASENK